MLSSERCRLVDFSELMLAFGLKIRSGANKRVIREKLQQRLLNEFHFRLHTHAPQSFIDHCSRRNTAWYIAKTSVVASWLGWLIAVVVLFARAGIPPASCKQLAGIVASIAVFVIVIPLALSRQGTKWNQEFWGVCWMWIHWDRQSHPAPHGWLGELPCGVEWTAELPNSGKENVGKSC
jgi:hypothetical protein